MFLGRSIWPNTQAIANNIMGKGLAGVGGLEPTTLGFGVHPFPLKGLDISPNHGILRVNDINWLRGKRQLPEMKKSPFNLHRAMLSIRKGMADAAYIWRQSIPNPQFTGGPRQAVTSTNFARHVWFASLAHEQQNPTGDGFGEFDMLKKFKLVQGLARPSPA